MASSDSMAPPVEGAQGGTERSGDVSELVVRRLQPAIGAEIGNLDLRRPVPPTVARFLRDALLKYGVIFLPKQQIDSDGYIALGELFAKVRLAVDEEGRNRPLTRLKASAGRADQAANVWHSEESYTRIPPDFSMLRAIQASPLGGDTCFSSAVAAYAGLSDAVKERIRPLRFRSSYAYVISRYPRYKTQEELEEEARRFPEVEHPVVRIHPETGLPIIYVNDGHTIDIVGLSAQDSATLLRRLTDEFKRPENQCRWKWSDGDIAIWDNRTVQHYGVPDQSGDRIMEVLTLGGSPVTGPR